MNCSLKGDGLQMVGGWAREDFADESRLISSHLDCVETRTQDAREKNSLSYGWEHVSIVLEIRKQKGPEDFRLNQS